MWRLLRSSCAALRAPRATLLQALRWGPSQVIWIVFFTWSPRGFNPLEGYWGCSGSALGAKATQAKVASGSRPLVAWMRRSASSGGVGNKPFQWSGSVFRGSPWKLCNSIPLWCRRAAKGKDAFRRAGQFCWFVRGFRTRQLRWSSEAEEWPFVLMIHVRYVNTQII